MKTIINVSDNEAWQRFDRIRQAKVAIEEMGFIIGADLYVFKYEKQYIELGYDSFNQFLADPDIDIAQRTADRMIRNFEMFILSATVADPAEALETVRANKFDYYNLLLKAGVYKLDRVASVMQENNKYEWINKAATLSRSDLEIAIRGEHSIVPSYWQTLLDQMRDVSDKITSLYYCPDWLRQILNEMWRQIDDYSAPEPSSKPTSPDCES